MDKIGEWSGRRRTSGSSTTAWRRRARRKSDSCRTFLAARSSLRRHQQIVSRRRLCSPASASSSTSLTEEASYGARLRAATTSPSLCRVAASRCHRGRLTSTGPGRSHSVSSPSRPHAGSPSGGVAPDVGGGLCTSSATDRQRAQGRVAGGPPISVRGSPTLLVMDRRFATCSRSRRAGSPTALLATVPFRARCATGQLTRYGWC